MTMLELRRKQTASEWPTIFAMGFCSLMTFLFVNSILGMSIAAGFSIWALFRGKWALALASTLVAGGSWALSWGLAYLLISQYR